MKLTANHAEIRQIIKARNAELREAKTEAERDEILARYTAKIDEARGAAR